MIGSSINNIRRVFFISRIKKVHFLPDIMTKDGFLLKVMQL
jgi:hypothetical protein